MQNIGKWASNANSWYKIGYDPNSWREAIEEARDLEESHWSFTDIRLIETNKTFDEGESAVLARGEAVVGLSDLSLSLSMTFVKTGVRFLSWEKIDTSYPLANTPKWLRLYLNIDSGLRTFVKTGAWYRRSEDTDKNNLIFARVPECTRGFRLCVGFAAAGLYVFDGRDEADKSFGVVVGRQFFG